MKVAVNGYLGFSSVVLLAQHHEALSFKTFDSRKLND